MSKNAIGFNPGLRGDIIINTVAAKQFKKAHPDWNLFMGIHNRFKDMIPLFSKHPYIDYIFEWEGYDAKWPTANDIKTIQQIQPSIIFNPFAAHHEDRWFEKYHQSQEVCNVYGLEIPWASVDCQCVLNENFLRKNCRAEGAEDIIVFAPCGAAYAGYPNHKSYTPEQCAAIIDFVKNHLGYTIIQIGGPGDPYFEGAATLTNKTDGSDYGSYTEAVSLMLGAKGLITVDTGICWLASALNVPTVACYANAYYGEKYVSSIQPFNPNSLYLDAPTIKDIEMGRLLNTIELLFGKKKA